MRFNYHLLVPAAALIAFPAFGWSQASTTSPQSPPPPPASAPVPPGATSWDYKTYDKDPFFNPDDLLEAESGLPITDMGPASHVQVNWDDLYCEDGTVKGPEGSSGGSEAEVYVVFTFHFPNGGKSKHVTDVQKIDCDDLSNNKSEQEATAK